MPDGELDLIQRAIGGDRLAFEEMVRRTSGMLYARLYLECGDRHCAEDLLQETLLAAYQTLHQLIDPRNFRSWLLTIAQTKIIDAARRQGRQKRSGPQAHPDALASAPGKTPPPHEQLEQDEERQEVLAILRSMPEEYRFGEEKGYVSTVNSDKLANGKVRGSVIVRVAPERLDTLLLKLRGLGVLKSQRIGSQDVTKQYVDLASQLRAARMMEARLLEIIKTGKGEIKDLLQAEKQLGEKRKEIEIVEGELRYYSNLVALSTLTVNLVEREIQAASGITETSLVQIGIEVEDVEKAQQLAHAAVTEAKGRILKSELKQNGPGKQQAVIKFQVAPDAAGALRDRLRQLGEVTRQDVGRLYQAEGGTERLPATKVTREDVVIELSLFNLANFAPRESVLIDLIAADAEDVYRAVLERARKASARIDSQNLNRRADGQTTGKIAFEVKSADADAVLADLKAQGEVIRLQVVENPQPSNATRSKRGFVVQVLALGTVKPRETATISVATRDVPAAFKTLQEAVAKNKGHVRSASLNEQDRQNVTAQLDFEVLRADEAAMRTALAGVGDVIARNVQRPTERDDDRLTDSKVLWQVTLINQVNMKPRETVTLGIEVLDVDRTVADFTAAVTASKGRIIDTTADHLRNGSATARLVCDVPFDQAAGLKDRFRQAGEVRLLQTVRNPQVPEGELAIVRIDVNLSNEPIVASDRGFGISFRKGLEYSATALSLILTCIIVGLSVVAPLAITCYGVLWVLRKLRTPTAPA